jgi:TRAP-type mannitol/chloroaromatic compound transport system permease small subunit
MKDYAGKFVDLIDAINTKTATWFSLLVPVGIAVVVLDVGIRYFVPQYTLVWAYDLSWMLFSFYFMFAVAYTLLVKGHVRVDVIHNYWSRRTQALIDIAYYLIFFVPIVVLIIIYGVPYAVDSIARKEVWMGAWLPPVYHMKTLIPVAFSLFLLQIISEIIKCVKILIASQKVKNQ